MSWPAAMLSEGDWAMAVAVLMSSMAPRRIFLLLTILFHIYVR